MCEILESQSITLIDIILTDFKFWIDEDDDDDDEDDDEDEPAQKTKVVKQVKKKEESDDDEEDDEESDEEEESDEGTTCTIKTLCSQFYLKKLDVRPILYNRFYTIGVFLTDPIYHCMEQFEFSKNWILTEFLWYYSRSFRKCYPVLNVRLLLVWESKEISESNYICSSWCWM